jgi:uncharacterized protein YecE (DUF72 family)
MPSWFEDDADAMLVERRIARVAADPAVVPLRQSPAGGAGLAYYRLHGSPQIYRSPYDEQAIAAQAARIAAMPRPAWRSGRSTTTPRPGAAMANALDLRDRLG